MFIIYWSTLEPFLNCCTSRIFTILRNSKITAIIAWSSTIDMLGTGWSPETVFSVWSYLKKKISHISVILLYNLSIGCSTVLKGCINYTGYSQYIMDWPGIIKWLDGKLWNLYIPENILGKHTVLCGIWKIFYTLRNGRINLNVRYQHNIS